MLRTGVLHQHENLSFGFIDPINYIRNQQINQDLVGRLGLETTLKGHQGCVNCLEWNDKGTLLASGSDDRSIIIWDPFERKIIHNMNTDHTANIFAVKFLPNLSDSFILTGAADSKLFMHDVAESKTIRSFPCHGRIKRLAYTSAEPFLFWAASEDGTCRQYDLRESSQSGADSNRNVLVNLRLFGDVVAEAKSVAVNPLKPELIALGSNQPYVRVFDRRMLTLFASGDTTHQYPFRHIKSEGVASNSVQYYVPAHLASKISDLLTSSLFSTSFSTNVCFSPNGQDLLANIERDNIYLFDLARVHQSEQCSNLACGQFDPTLFRLDSSQADQAFKTTTPNESGRRQLFKSASKICQCDLNTTTQLILCPASKSVRASKLVEARAFTAAVFAYNELICRWPSDPQLRIGRATALFGRIWKGDVYAALLDCQAAMKLISQHYQSLKSVNFQHQPKLLVWIYFTALLLAIRCAYILKWYGICRTLLKRGIRLFRPLDCDQDVGPHDLFSISRHVFRQAFEHFYSKLIHKMKSRSSIPAPNMDVVESFCSPSNTSLSDESDVRINSNGKDNYSTNSPTTTFAFNPNPWDHNLDWSKFDISDVASCLCASCSHANVPINAIPCEWELKRRAFDYAARYAGHCNVITDIKEPNFFGSNGQYIVAGSDCGSFFIWDRNTTNIVRILNADSSTVNCVQPHPSVCVLASSGIENVIRLWSPNCEEDPHQTSVVKDHIGAVERNQRYSDIDPMEIMLFNMGHDMIELDFLFPQNDVQSTRRRSPGDDDDSNNRHTPPAPSAKHTCDDGVAARLHPTASLDPNDRPLVSSVMATLLDTNLGPNAMSSNSASDCDEDDAIGGGGGGRSKRKRTTQLAVNGERNRLSEFLPIYHLIHFIEQDASGQTHPVCDDDGDDGDDDDMSTNLDTPL